MKFRLKWKLSAIYWQIPTGAIAVVWLIGRSHFSNGLTHLLGQSTLNFLLLGSLIAADRACTVWEVSSDALRQRWFGIKTKEFEWDDVIRIGLVNYERPDSCGIEIEYVPHSATKNCWRALKIAPAERDRFIAAIRKFARRATFDVKSDLQ